MTIHLATGIAIRDGRLLLVASRYPNQSQPLWSLPGGRQQTGELLVETVVREFYEETGLRVHPSELAYVSESYDGEKHFVNATFLVACSEPSPEQGAQRSRSPGRRVRATQTDEQDHVVAVDWVPLGDVRERIAVRVVREPLLAYLQGALEWRYAGFHDAGITIEWPSGSV